MKNYNFGPFEPFPITSGYLNFSLKIRPLQFSKLFNHKEHAKTLKKLLSKRREDTVDRYTNSAIFAGVSI